MGGKMARRTDGLTYSPSFPCAAAAAPVLTRLRVTRIDRDLTAFALPAPGAAAQVGGGWLTHSPQAGRGAAGVTGLGGRQHCYTGIVTI